MDHQEDHLLDDNNILDNPFLPPITSLLTDMEYSSPQMTVPTRTMPSPTNSDMTSIELVDMSCSRACELPSNTIVTLGKQVDRFTPEMNQKLLNHDVATLQSCLETKGFRLSHSPAVGNQVIGVPLCTIQEPHIAMAPPMPPSHTRKVPPKSIVGKKNEDYLREISSSSHVVNPDGRSYKYTCPWPGCMKEFGSFSDLASHYIGHTKERPHACMKCNASFARKHDLNRHVRVAHKQGQKVTCENCHKSFSRLDSLKRHVREGKCRHVCTVAKRHTTM